MTDSLTRRGPNANRSARLPGLQTSRVADPNVRQALDKLREWVEVRLGSRGDEFERAVTKRELTQLLAELSARIKALEDLSKKVDEGAATIEKNNATLATEINALRTSSQNADAAIRSELTRISTRLSSVVVALDLDL